MVVAAVVVDTTEDKWQMLKTSPMDLDNLILEYIVPDSTYAGNFKTDWQDKKYCLLTWTQRSNWLTNLLTN